MRPTQLDFYFDFISPYAYFAWQKLEPLCEEYQLELRPHPVVFGKLLDHWGQLGPAEVPPKKEAVGRYCLRYAAINGLEYNPPKYHPYNPLPSLRLALKEVSGDQQLSVIDAIFNAGWAHGEDLGEAQHLIEILQRAGIDTKGLDELITQQSVKDVLIKETSNAIEQGVFGVPTIIIGDQLFWGNDQFDHIKLLLEGKDPLDGQKHKLLQSRPRMIDRKKIRDQK
ncbi:MAG: thioredoxin domain-containing protein [Pseudomonadales bacterium]|nr:thioredoxin domain-containing protein [Pseudomonadales bacterium]